MLCGLFKEIYCTYISKSSNILHKYIKNIYIMHDSWSLRATHPVARSPIKEERSHPGAGRDPVSASAGFVLWMQAYAGMTI